MNNTHLRVMLALACIAPLTGCSGKSGAEAAVRERLKDPESARFGDFYYNAETKRGCLTVNARNTMGGYVGDQQAHVERTAEGWVVPDIADEYHDTCGTDYADEPAK